MRLHGQPSSWVMLDAYLWRRDGGCIARFVNNTLWAGRWPMLQGLPDPGPCRNAAGDERSPYDRENCTREHVKDEPGMSARAENDEDHTVIVCWGHHVFGRQWCTGSLVRAAVRLYIAAANQRLSTERGQLSTGQGG